MDPSTQDQVAFWRTLAERLRDGRSLTEAFGEAASQREDTVFAEVAAAAVQRAQEGGGLAETIAEFPDLFEERVVKAIAEGERSGLLDVAMIRVAKALEAGDLGVLAAPAAEEIDATQEPQVKEYVNRTILEAIRSDATDIHFDPTEDGRGRVRVRIDGVLHEAGRPPEGMFPKVVRCLKVMSCLDVAERKLPQDGRVGLKVEGQAVNLRLSTLPTYCGERVMARVLARQNVPLELPRLGLDEEDLANVRRLCHLPCGIVVVNGPTGCGKTTLLYSMLREIDRHRCCVMTVEDPVEFAIEGVAQLQIRPPVGWTFARAMRAMLRQDPDVILVGELRDLEMMNLAVQIAMTGHLLLTTLHARTSVGAIRRLLDCGLEPFMINSTLQAVVSLRLVRLLCDRCKQPAEPDEAAMSPEAVQIVSALKDAEFHRPVGCEHCRQTGYRGRTGIYEVLIIDEAVRGTVSKPPDTAAMLDAARRSGMKTMLADGLEKAARGVTSIEEVCRIAPRAGHV